MSTVSTRTNIFYINAKCVFVLSVCGKTKADIVFLVDESSSIGANNFIKMKDFMFRVATYFPSIGPQGTQVGLSVKPSVSICVCCFYPKLYGWTTTFKNWIFKRWWLQQVSKRLQWESCATQCHWQEPNGPLFHLNQTQTFAERITGHNAIWLINVGRHGRGTNNFRRRNQMHFGVVAQSRCALQCYDDVFFLSDRRGSLQWWASNWIPSKWL